MVFKAPNRFPELAVWSTAWRDGVGVYQTKNKLLSARMKQCMTVYCLAHGIFHRVLRLRVLVNTGSTKAGCIFREAQDAIVEGVERDCWKWKR